MPSQEVIVLSDDASDDDIAFVGSSKSQWPTNPASPSPVFMRTSRARAVDVIDLLEEDEGDDALGDLVFPMLGSVNRSALGACRSLPLSSNAVASSSRASALGWSHSTAFADTSTLQSKERSMQSLQATRSLLDIINDPSLYDAPAARARPSPSPAPDASPARPKVKKRKTQTNKENSPGDDPVAAAKAAEKVERDKAAAATKEKQKAERQLARDTAKATKEAEKSYQKKVSEVNRLRTSKIDALRDLEVHLSHDLSLPSAPIAGAIPELRRRIEESLSSIHVAEEEDTVVEGTIRFLRRVTAEWDAVAKIYVPIEVERKEWEPTTVLVASGEAIVDRVAQGGDALTDWLSDVQLTLDMKTHEQLMLVVRGLEKYHSKTKSIANRAFRETARAGLAGEGVAGVPTSVLSARVDKDQVEAELLRAQVVQRVFVVHVEKTEDLEDWLFNLAGDIAVRPHKLLSKGHLPFSAPERAKKTQEAGETLECMLQEVQGLTASAAYGVVETYPSFRGLMRAYEQAEHRADPSVAENMLADCDIRSLKNGTASNRKVGKALSKKVYNLMRGTDPLSLT